jgi:carbamate kinase
MSIYIEYHKKTLSLISYVVAQKNDLAFKNPTKLIGPVFSKEQAETALPYGRSAKGLQESRRLSPTCDDY